MPSQVNPALLTRMSSCGRGGGERTFTDNRHIEGGGGGGGGRGWLLLEVPDRALHQLLGEAVGGDAPVDCERLTTAALNLCGRRARLVCAEVVDDDGRAVLREECRDRLPDPCSRPQGARSQFTAKPCT
jgi:hypothetical protein